MKNIIHRIDDHPNKAVLTEYPLPTGSLLAWHAFLDGKAWVNKYLFCFFTDINEPSVRFAIPYPPKTDFAPTVNGEQDMRLAPLGRCYEIHTFESDDENDFEVSITTQVDL